MFYANDPETLNSTKEEKNIMVMIFIKQTFLFIIIYN